MNWDDLTRAERLVLAGFALIHLGVIVSGLAALAAKPWKVIR